MYSSATLFGTRNFKPRHCNSGLCYSNRVFSYVPRFNQQNIQKKNEIKQKTYMFRQYDITRNNLQKKNPKILKMYYAFIIFIVINISEGTRSIYDIRLFLTA